MLLVALDDGSVEDMDRLRQDEGLKAMLGYVPPARETARQWLGKFHDGSLMEGQPLQGAFLPAESGPLAGLREPNRQAIWSQIEKVNPGWDVTLDVDAQLVETAKANPLCCYECYKAFQPIHVSLTETMLVLADEFRQGNVPAGKDTKRIPGG